MFFRYYADFISVFPQPSDLTLGNTFGNGATSPSTAQNNVLDSFGSGLVDKYSIIREEASKVSKFWDNRPLEFTSWSCLAYKNKKINSMNELSSVL